jgi:predicted CXXCH cytochrome family protein
VPAPALAQGSGPGNEYCLACHSQPEMSTRLVSNESLALSVDPALFAASVHASQGIACVDCHPDITGFPHPDYSLRDRRDLTLQLYATCQTCHSDMYNLQLDSVHGKALAGGNRNAAVCTDCHNPHTQTSLRDAAGALTPAARLAVPQTCARCHSAIYEEYRASVHGAALIGDPAKGMPGGNPDVPTCVDCHGVHSIEDPTTAAFRLRSPQLCASCHADPPRMDKYGLSTAVMSTYVADFHGTTITLFEQLSPDAQTNKPVCYDCHGVHNIQRVDDPQKGLQVKENLLRTCQKCHPGATANFPDSWLSHYIPDPERNSLVYYVDLFYKIFIPVVLGGMGVFVVSDIVRRLIDRRKGAKAQ